MCFVGCYKLCTTKARLCQGWCPCWANSTWPFREKRVISCGACKSAIAGKACAKTSCVHSYSGSSPHRFRFRRTCALYRSQTEGNQLCFVQFYTRSQRTVHTSNFAVYFTLSCSGRKSSGKQHKRLVVMAKQVLCATTTTTEIERTFNVAGVLLSDHRLRTTDTNFEKRLVCKANCDLLYGNGGYHKLS